MKRNVSTDMNLKSLPEEITEEGIKIYGETSYETQVAILSHHLHSLDGKHDIGSERNATRLSMRYVTISTINSSLTRKIRNGKISVMKK